MIRLELQPEIEAQFASQAEAEGLPIERYVEGLLTSVYDRSSRVQNPSSGTCDARTSETPAEAVAAIRRRREGLSLDGLSVKELINEGRKY